MRLDKIGPFRRFPSEAFRVMPPINLRHRFLVERARAFADFLRIRVTALLACRRGIDWLKLTPTLSPVNANWRRPNWIIGGNPAIAASGDVNIYTVGTSSSLSSHHCHFCPRFLYFFNFSTYLLSNLLTCAVRLISARWTFYFFNGAQNSHLFSSKFIYPIFHILSYGKFFAPLWDQAT